MFKNGNRRQSSFETRWYATYYETRSSCPPKKNFQKRGPTLRSSDLFTERPNELDVVHSPTRTGPPFSNTRDDIRATGTLLNRMASVIRRPLVKRFVFRKKDDRRKGFRCNVRRTSTRVRVNNALCPYVEVMRGSRARYIMYDRERP